MGLFSDFDGGVFGGNDSGGGGGTTSSNPNPPVDPGGDVAIQDLYGEAPVAEALEVPDVPAPTGADVVLNDASVAEVNAPGAAIADPGGTISEAEGIVAEQTDLTEEQQVDAELARIMGQDSPLMARARTEAAQYANTRGLQNTSMAAGMAEGAMVDRAMPMAQQNAAQAALRESQNTGFRQQATTFSASEQNRINALSAQLGTDVSMFNADQLNEAERLSAQLRTALEQQDTEAANRAELQLAELMRQAQAQQADIDFTAEQQRAAEQQSYNLALMDRVSSLNEQFLRGEQAMDLATIQGDYQQIISTNATAGSIYQGAMAAIGEIMDDPNMTPAQIASAVNVLAKQLEGGLAMIAEINGMDFGDIAGTIPSGDAGQHPVVDVNPPDESDVADTRPTGPVRNQP